MAGILFQFVRLFIRTTLRFVSVPSKDYSNHELKMKSEQSTNENKQKKKGKLYDTNLESVVKLGQFTFCISFFGTKLFKILFSTLKLVTKNGTFKICIIQQKYQRVDISLTRTMKNKSQSL